MGICIRRVVIAESWNGTRGEDGDAAVDAEAAERQAVASPSDFIGSCSVGGGLRFAPRGLSWDGPLTGGCAPRRSLYL